MNNDCKRVFVYIMKPEEWKDIDGDMFNIKSMYQISNHGRIRNKYTKHILSVSINNVGYRYVKIQRADKPNKNKTILLYKLTAIYFCKKEHDYYTTPNHLDEDPSNDYYENLKWSTQSENFWWSAYKSSNFGETAFKNVYPESLIRSICDILEEGDGSPISIMKKLNLLDKYDKQKMKKLILHLKFREDWCRVTKDYTYKYLRSTTIENSDEYYTIDIPSIEFVDSKLLDECNEYYNIIIK